MNISLRSVNGDFSLRERKYAHGIPLDCLAKQTDAFSKSHFPEGAQLCAKCSTAAVVMMDGCNTCLNCGDSKCG